ncbi:unnamed protein product, partial [Staurois parvus]
LTLLYLKAFLTQHFFTPAKDIPYFSLHLGFRGRKQEKKKF